MKLDGRRESTNVDDRRGKRAVVGGGLGLGGIIIVGLIAMFLGKNPTNSIEFITPAQEILTKLSIFSQDISDYLDLRQYTKK